MVVLVASLCGACSDEDEISIDGGIAIDALAADVGSDGVVQDAQSEDTCVPGSTVAVDMRDAFAAPAVLFGLDNRPANTTCRALPRPTGLANDPFPQTLLATGCFEPSDLREPVAGLIPYDVNAPLWSDGAVKRRFMMVPDGQRIRVLPDGDFVLPVGSMLFKTFELAGKMLETRFLVRHTDGDWAGYTYVWDQDGKNEAKLLGDETSTRSIGLQTWQFPSRSACLSCHTEAAGRSLGLELGQLNGDHTYPGDRKANQLATLEHIGLFESALSPAQYLVRYAAATASSSSLQVRARSYLHSNCSHCHRPNGLQTEGNLPDIDLRFDVVLAQTNLINRMPVRGEFGVPGVLLVKPGAPLQSMLTVRMKTTVANVRMPAIGSTVVDATGVALINEWIASMQTCR
ncbi:MAG: hypothetical protein SF187_08350 [Deltaproteobacteria bacterium]|nr:hypothetical protein [Deltaproteobacteria bacterium]